MRVRKPAVAGSFYPSSKDDLLVAIKNCFEHKYGPQKKLPAEGNNRKIIGVVCPHAGYMYSGPVAAHSYYAASALNTDLVIMIGPNHYGVGSGVATAQADSWESPLGTVNLDGDARAQIVKHSGIVDLDDAAHSEDHSLEVQLPMLQYIYRDFKIVPIIMWMQDKETAEEVGKALAEICKDRKNVLLLASSDFTHYEPNKDAHRKDNELIKTILDLDISKFYSVLRRLKVTACGYGAIASVMVAARVLGADGGELLKYATSGDIAGKTDSVVGYGSILFK